MLQSQGYEVQVAFTLDQALNVLRPAPAPNVVLAEVDVAGGRGVDLCAAVRKLPHCRDTLFVFVAQQAEEIDRVVAFEVGADDFIAKPFSVPELLLRLRALLRRVSGGAEAFGIVGDGRLDFDLIRRRVRLAGRDVEVSRFEFAVLHLLVSQPEHVFHRREIVAAVWGEVGRVQERTVDCIVKRLRHKLGGDGGALETVRGVGFRWRRSLNAGQEARRPTVTLPAVSRRLRARP